MQLSENPPITELMDPLAVRLGMKRTYTGNAEELVGELLQFYFFDLYVHDATSAFSPVMRFTY